MPWRDWDVGLDVGLEGCGGFVWRSGLCKEKRKGQGTYSKVGSVLNARGVMKFP